ncbi:MAG: MbnP family protein [Fluviicola sp.]
MKTKYLLTGLLLAGTVISAEAQTDIDLILNHEFNGATFQYGTTYDLNGTAVSLSRAQYYLCGFELTHDGGQTTSMPDTYVLASGNVSTYTLGSENVTNIEGISFDLGVDAARNGMGTQSWPAGHPLAAQSPSMDWSWPGGYFFWVLDGDVDTDADGTPDQAFSLRGLGDQLLTDVSPFTGINASGSTISIGFDVNIADWLQNIDLATVFSQHDAGTNNQLIGTNTNDETVFTLNSSLNTGELMLEESHIYADYQMSYAPTIYYDLATTSNVDITVVEMTGSVVLEATNQNPEGNYFIRKELPDGTYLINFSNGELNEQFRFVVKN